MEILIEWHNDQFNVNLVTQPGKEPFISIKGARIANGKNGPFVSWPATKNERTGKWWNHVYGSDSFNAVVLSKAQESQPRQSPRRQSQPAGADEAGDIPW